MNELILLNDEKLNDDEIKVFNEQYLAAIISISDFTQQKKKIEEQEKQLKKKLERAFEEYGIKSLDNDYIKITRVAAGKDSITIDLKEFEKQEPETFKEILEDYPKTTKGKAAYIRFSVK